MVTPTPSRKNKLLTLEYQRKQQQKKVTGFGGRELDVRYRINHVIPQRPQRNIRIPRGRERKSDTTLAPIPDTTRGVIYCGRDGPLLFLFLHALRFASSTIHREGRSHIKLFETPNIAQGKPTRSNLVFLLLLRNTHRYCSV